MPIDFPNYPQNLVGGTQGPSCRRFRTARSRVYPNPATSIVLYLFCRVFYSCRAWIASTPGATSAAAPFRSRDRAKSSRGRRPLSVGKRKRCQVSPASLCDATGNGGPYCAAADAQPVRGRCSCSRPTALYADAVPGFACPPLDVPRRPACRSRTGTVSVSDLDIASAAKASRHRAVISPSQEGKVYRWHRWPRSDPASHRHSLALLPRTRPNRSRPPELLSTRWAPPFLLRLRKRPLEPD